MASVLPAVLLLGLVIGLWWFGVLRLQGKVRDSRHLLLLIAITGIVIVGGIAFAELRR